MTTFYEHFLNEIQRKLDAGEIDMDKAKKWITDIKETLSLHPGHPLAQMPTEQ